MRATHFAFRAGASGWSTRDAAYTIDASSAGFSFIPRRGDATSAALRLELARLARGEVRLGERLTSSVDDNGHLRHERADGVTEELTNGEHGTEQSWRFESRPRGSGDLTVRLTARGQRYLTTTDHGLHFVDDSTGVGVRYGHATWIDRAGKRSTIAARWDDSDIVLTVPSATVDASTYPATLDPLVGPEFAVDDPAYVTAGGAIVPKIAAGGGEFLVVWEDNRANATGGDTDVYGARVSSAGVLLDKLGIRITSATGTEYSPSVVYDGTDFVVVWTSGGTVIRGARVAVDGTVLDPSGVTIGTPPTGSQSYPTIAFDGTNMLVVWQRNFTNADIYATRLTPSMTVLDPAGIVVGVAANTQQQPSVAFDGSNYLVVWADDRTTSGSYKIRGTRVTKAGVVLDPSSVLIGNSPHSQFNADVTSDGSQFFVVWRDYVSGDSNLYGARVDAGGTTLDTTPIAIATAAGDQQAAAVAFDGTDFVVAWEDASATTQVAYARRVSKLGALVEASPTRMWTSTKSQQNPDIAYDGTNSLIIWSGVEGIRFSGLTPIDSSPISIHNLTSAETSPAIAFDGTRALVMWQDTRGGARDVYAARLSSTGTSLDPAGILVANVTVSTNISIATNGSTFYAAWSKWNSATSNDVYGTRISTSGAILDPPGGNKINTLAGTNTAPSVASDGTDFFVVFQGSIGGAQIHGARVTSGGVVSAASPIVAGNRPVIAYAGGNYMLAWEKPTASDVDLYASRLSTAGALLDGTGFLVAGGTGYQDLARITANTSDFYLVWEDTRPTNPGFYGARISTAGVLLDTGGVLIATGYRNINVGWDGNGFIAVLQEQVTATNNDLRAARISPAGVVADKPPFAIATTPSHEYNAGIAGMGGGKSMVVYQHTIVDASFASDRLRARILDTTPVTTCTSGSTCASGFCVDGFCCDTACGGGVTTDCLACSVAAGADSDGICGLVKATTVCRPAAGPCDLPEVCNGIGTSCPGNAFATDGVSCDDGIICNGVASCSGGVCVNEPTDCNDGNACTIDACYEPSGCSHSAIPSCDAGVADTGADSSSDTGSVLDSGSPVVDTGSPVVDTGSPVVDTGSPVVDTGSPVVDTGSPVVDTGSPVVDTGSPEMDTSVVTDSTVEDVMFTDAPAETTGKSDGVVCSSADECSSGFCVDGVCCNVSCESRCQACDQPGKIGTCAVVSGAPHGTRMPCGDGSECAGRCDGIDSLSCTFPAAGGSCGTSCEGDSLATKACDGKGSCVTQSAVSCAPYACASGKCADACTKNADCASDSICSGGVCIGAGAPAVADEGGCTYGSGRSGAWAGAAVALLAIASSRRRPVRSSSSS